MFVLVGLLETVGVVVDVCRGRMAGRDGLAGNTGGWFMVDDDVGSVDGGGDELFNDLLNNAALLA